MVGLRWDIPATVLRNKFRPGLGAAARLDAYVKELAKRKE